MSLTAHERETTITASDGDDTVRIWTAQRTVITAMRKRGATEVRSGEHDGTAYAEFVVPAASFKLAMAVRPPKRVLSDEERARVRERLAGRRSGGES